jgi:hypothetical protein
MSKSTNRMSVAALLAIGALTACGADGPTSGVAATTVPNLCTRAASRSHDASSTSPERVVALNLKLVGCASGRPVYEVLEPRDASAVREIREPVGY